MRSKLANNEENVISDEVKKVTSEMNFTEFQQSMCITDTLEYLNQVLVWANKIEATSSIKSINQFQEWNLQYEQDSRLKHASIGFTKQQIEEIKLVGLKLNQFEIIKKIHEDLNQICTKVVMQKLGKGLPGEEISELKKFFKQAKEYAPEYSRSIQKVTKILADDDFQDEAREYFQEMQENTADYLLENNDKREKLDSELKDIACDNLLSTHSLFSNKITQISSSSFSPTQKNDESHVLDL